MLRLTLLFTCIAPCVPAQVAAPATRPSAETLRAALEAIRARQELVGLAGAVIRDGKVVWSGGVGFADREKKAKVDSDTMFRWASISKPVAAVAALQLVEADTLALSTTVRSLLPEFPKKPWPITLRQLLCHQGGIVHYTNGKVIRTERDYDVEHPFADLVLALDTFKESPLVAEPGTKFSYSTHGFILAGAMVARAGKASFWHQVRDRIAKPLGMKSFRPDYQWEKIEHRAVGYRRRLGKVVRSTNTDVSWKLPGGGFISNVGDLARFGAGLIDGKLLQPATLASMTTAQKTRDGKPTTYGLGIGVGKSGDARVWSHSGAQEKTRTMLLLFPDRRAGVALMTNSEYGRLRTPARRFARLLK